MTPEPEVACLVDSRCRLGEGPCWSAPEGRLYWVDIKGRTLHWYAPQEALAGSAELGFRASAAAACAGGGLILATDKGLAHWDPARERARVLAPLRLPEGFRTNEGNVDPSGAFWWSTMDDDGGRRPGAILRTVPSGDTQVVLDGIHIANTMAFSADGRRLYLSDSRLQTIFLYDAPHPAERRVFATTGDATAPDGGAMDAEGGLWNAQWGGARVVRYTPDGEVDRTVALPVSQPTSCAFGGPDLATLYITSAWDDLPAETREAEPLAGGLFALRPGVAGQALPLFDARALIERGAP
jgi:sugar lactone lactonase YvrE